MIESKKDMFTLKVFSLLIGGVILFLLYEANQLAFECIRIKSLSIIWFTVYLLTFLGLIVICVLLMKIVVKTYIHVCVKNSIKMFSKMCDTFAFSVTSVCGFSLMHLSNIFLFDGKLGTAEICILSLLFSLIGTVVNLLFIDRLT